MISDSKIFAAVLGLSLLSLCVFTLSWLLMRGVKKWRGKEIKKDSEMPYVLMILFLIIVFGGGIQITEDNFKRSIYKVSINNELKNSSKNNILTDGAGIPALLESENSYEVRVFVESLQGGGKTFIAKKSGKDEKEKYYFADKKCSNNIPVELTLPIMLVTFESGESGQLGCLWLPLPKRMDFFPEEKPDE